MRKKKKNKKKNKERERERERERESGAASLSHNSKMENVIGGRKERRNDGPKEGRKDGRREEGDYPGRRFITPESERGERERGEKRGFG